MTSVLSGKRQIISEGISSVLFRSTHTIRLVSSMSATPFHNFPSTSTIETKTSTNFLKG